MKVIFQAVALAVLVVYVSGHGRVLHPPSRASMWRYGYKTPANYDDSGVNCGGYGHQYDINGGKCGICGDAYDEPVPRSHELGGRYGLGIIVAEYEAGEVFTATVEITAYHKGYWYFKICPDPSSNEQSCFDQYPVELEEGGTDYYPPSSGIFQVNYRIPENVTCDHCVLQWWYRAGNSWGTCKDGSGAIGCGNQEYFGACTDITIKAKTPIIPEGIPIELN
ncbi:chitin binding domain 3 protein [Danaus plexippus plexippus]|uniref:Chitin binding domain 3 protein n=1 Tax=Danaus plexippus plexippus TaxID=278856 RepID=A0A212F705_DANPL|nr:chitin binding domain 3 protein [Danaus plexippus plexippus]